jgi:hypothetical protein
MKTDNEIICGTFYVKNLIKISRVKMGRKIFILMFAAGMGILYSCGNSSKKTDDPAGSASAKIIQQQDGTISLNLDKAGRYSDLIMSGYQAPPAILQI